MPTYTFKQPPLLPPAAGKLLIAAPFLNDNNFLRTVILLCEYSSEGAVGYVLNQPLDASISEVLPETGNVSQLIYKGGPVQMNTLHFVHTLPHLLKGSPLPENICWGGDFEKLEQLLQKEKAPITSLKIFLGYSGWGAGQLEAEIEQGAWIVTAANASIVFETPSTWVWKKAIELLGTEYQYLSQMPVNPSMN